MGIFSGLQIGSKALSAYNVAMQLLGHNIANADTEGYTRQRVRFVTSQPDVFSYGSLGTGVDIGTIERVRDSYLDIQMYRENGSLSKWNSQDEYLSQLELYFNEPSDTGLSSMLNTFWQGWQDLANDPEDQITRTSLIQQSLTFTENLNDVYEKTKQLRVNIDEQMEADVNKVNNIATQIASLNGQILQSESNGNTANDLRDRRDNLIKGLSELVDFTANEQSSGVFSISIGSKQLVWGTQTSSLTVAQNPDNEFALIDIKWADSGTTVTPTSGELGGLLYARDTIIPKYVDKLDEMVKNMIIEVNSMHSKGMGLEGYSTITSENAVTDPTALLSSSASGLDFYNKIKSGTISISVKDSGGNVTTTQIAVDAANMKLFDAGDPTHSLATLIDNVNNIQSVSVGADGKMTIQAASGYTFYVTDDATNSTNIPMALGINNFFSGSGASDITVSSNIQDSPNLIATARSTAPGDNSNALAVSGLKDATIDDLSATLNGYYNAQIVGALGVEAEQVNNQKENQDLIVQQLQDRIQNISGVSLDEEMTTMIQYQHAYSAAAKYIALSQQMLTDLVNIV